MGRHFRCSTRPTDPLGTPAAAYLRSRGLVPPFPPGVRWLEGARLGEGAIVGVLTTALGDPVGIQLGYPDPQGRKSVMHANSVLVAHGPEELRRLVTEAEPGQLSFEGELTRLFELNPAEYERERVEAAKKHRARSSTAPMTPPLGEPLQK